MDPYQLTSSLLDYDPEEEERKRTAALAALAASANPSTGAEAFTPELDVGGPEGADILSGRDPVDAMSLRPDPQLSAFYAPDLEPPAPGPEPVAAAALAAAGKPAPPPTAAPTAAATSTPAPPPEQDPFDALMRKGEEQRQRALDEYGKNEPSINGWALLADVAFNKGKSIPGMLAQVDNDKRAWRDGRAKLLTSGAGNDPVSQMLAMERIKVAQGNLGARHQTQERLSGKDAAAAAQTVQNRKGVLDQLSRMGATPEELEYLGGLDEKGFNLVMPTFRKRYEVSDENVAGQERLSEHKAAGTTRGRIKETHENIDTVSGDKAQVADAVAAAQAPHLATRPQTPDQIAADKMQRETLDEAKRARAERAAAAKAAAAEKATNAETAQVTKYSNDTEKTRAAAKILDELDDVIAKAKSEKRMPAGLGAEAALQDITKFPLDQSARGWVGVLAGGEHQDFQNEAIMNQQLLQRLGTTLYRIDTGASGNAREEIAAEIANATSKYATLPEIEATLRKVRGLLQTDIGGGLAVTNPELAGRTLASGGVRDPKRWISAYQGTQPSAAIDPTLGAGQTVVLNEDGEEVVEGAGAGAGGYDLPPEELVEPGLAAQPDSLTLGKTPGLPPLTPEQEAAKKRWNKYRRQQ